MRKKIMALLIFAIFVISLVPMAFAERQDNERGINGLKEKFLERRGNVLDKRAELIQNKVELLEKHKGQIMELIEKCGGNESETAVCKGRFEQRLRNLETLPEDFKLRLAEFEQKKLDTKEKLEELKKDSHFGKYKEELQFKVRSIQKLKLENARNEFAKIKFEFNESKFKLNNAKLRLDGAKELKACKENPNSEECTQAKAELLSAAKEHFTAQADNIIKTLEKIKASVQGNEDLTDAEEATMTADLTAKIAEITEIKAKISAATTKNELLTAARILKMAWGDMEHLVKKNAAKVVSSRMAGIIVTSKHLETKLNRVLERMTENGQNVTEVQPLVDEFNNQIDLAMVSFEESQELWIKVRSDADSNVTVQQAQEKLKEAKEHLTLAREELGKIIQKIDRGALKDINKEDENEDEDDDSSTPANATNTTANITA